METHALSTGGVEFVIRPDLFHGQFAADVPDAVAALMAATQRPVTEAALRDPTQAAQPGWTDRPSWHIFGSDDRNIPAAVMRAGADRADSRGTTEIPGASHALSVSQPEQVAQTILAATRALTPESERV